MCLFNVSIHKKVWRNQIFNKKDILEKGNFFIKVTLFDLQWLLGQGRTSWNEKFALQKVSIHTKLWLDKISNKKIPRKMCIFKYVSDLSLFAFWGHTSFIEKIIILMPSDQGVFWLNYNQLAYDFFNNFCHIFFVNKIKVL